MSALLPDVDPDGLREFSVVYTDRSLNHMSGAYQSVMNDISRDLKSVYGARSAVLVPGGGTFGMEAVARQFATDKNVVVIRNGWFSYRWSQIFDAGSIPASSTVLKARRTSDAHQAPFVPCPVDEVVETIRSERPAAVFAPHVETSAGMMLPDEWISAVAAAAHEVDALFVLDCIASGTIWIDMEALGVDVLCSAPQKGWSGPPCAGVVMLSERARTAIEDTSSTSFACDLRRWLGIMETYEGGGHAYHATMPTDALTTFRDVIAETKAFGFSEAKTAQQELGRGIRSVLADAGFPSVAGPGFEAPGVVVSYTDNPDIRSGSAFASRGVQIAAGVPLQVDEPADFSTFRVGLFGLDKLKDVDGTVAAFSSVLEDITAAQD